MVIFKVQVVNNSGQVSSDVSMAFTLRRGILTVIDSDPPFLPDHSDVGGQRSIQLLLSQGVAPGEWVEVTLDVSGQAPVVTKSAWKPRSIKLADADALIDRSATPTSAEAIFRWRRMAARGPYGRYQRMFNFIDRETSPQTSEIWTSVEDEYTGDRLTSEDPEFSLRNQALAYAARVVACGIEERLGGNERPYENGIVDPRYIRHISRIHLVAFRMLTRADVDGHGQAFDVREICDAFDLFSRGELALFGPSAPRSPIPDDELRGACQPDSSNFVHYAEFADLCVELGIHASLWAQLLPSLVVCIHLYDSVFGGPSRSANRVPFPPTRTGQSIIRTREIRMTKQLSNAFWWRRYAMAAHG